MHIILSDDAPILRMVISLSLNKLSNLKIGDCLRKILVNLLNHLGTLLGLLRFRRNLLLFPVL